MLKPYVSPVWSWCFFDKRCHFPSSPPLLLPCFFGSKTAPVPSENPRGQVPLAWCRESQRPWGHGFFPFGCWWFAPITCPSNWMGSLIMLNPSVPNSSDCWVSIGSGAPFFLSALKIRTGSLEPWKTGTLLLACKAGLILCYKWK